MYVFPMCKNIEMQQQKLFRSHCKRDAYTYNTHALTHEDNYYVLSYPSMRSKRNGKTLCPSLWQ
jgi:hypothetical protein